MTIARSQLLSQSYLELGQVVFSEGSSVRCHGDIIVELSQTGLTDLCSVFPQILLSNVKLNKKIKKEELVQM